MSRHSRWFGSLAVLATGFFLWAVPDASGQPGFELDQTYTVFSTTPDGLTGVDVADFDGDGDLDIVVSELRGEFMGSADSIAVFYNDGAGDFPIKLPLRGGDRITDVTAGDFNGDGWPDVATTMDNNQGSSGNGQVKVRLNDGTGLDFLPEISFNVAARPMCVVAGYVDGDSLLDLVTGNDYGKVSILLNDPAQTDPGTPGTLGFQAYYNIDFGGSSSIHAIHLADVDGDPDPDLFVGYNGFTSTSQLRVLVNDGSGGFTPSQTIPASGSVVGITSGDWDGDGDEDVAFVNGGTTTVTLGFNDGNGNFTATSFDAGVPQLASAAKIMGNADVDGDGDADLVVSTRDDVAVLPNDGVGVFGPASTFYTGSNPATYKLVLADLAGSDAPDLAVVNHGGSNELAVLFNTIPASFTAFGAAAGVADAGHGQGVAWGDYDDDGYLDLYVGNWGANRLYHNDGDETFSEVGTAAGVADPLTAISVAWGDYDDDGYLDLYVANREANHLYHNDGDGTFTEVGASAEVGDSGDANATWGDFNNDGWLDLYLAKSQQVNRLYLNDGDGTFTDVAASVGLDLTTKTGSAWGDFDDDGDLDLFVPYPLPEAGRLFRNDLPVAGSAAPWSFTDITSLSGVNATYARDAEWADYDNDGDLDLYVGRDPGYGNLLYENTEAGFVEVGASAGVDYTGPNDGLGWADYDSDGYLDLYVANSAGSEQAGYTPSLLYRNDGDKTFTNVAASVGVADVGKGRGIAWGDFNNDGYLDLYLARAPGNGSDSVNQLYRNSGGTDHSLAVKVVGTASNRAGIGARVLVGVGGQVLRRDVGGGGIFQSQSSLPAEFGLGDYTAIDSLVVHWPSGARWKTADLAIQNNDTLTVTEPMPVSLPDTVATYDEALQVPVRIGDITGLGIVSAEIFVAYDGDLLSVWSAPLSPVSATGMTADWTIEVNDVEGIGTPMDTLKIAMADEVALSGSGDLLMLNFTVADLRHPASSLLELAHVLLNDGVPGNQPVDGSVTLVGTDGTITSLPTEILPRWSVGVSVYDADEDRTSGRDAFDVAVANGAQTEVLTVFETGNTSGVFGATISTEFSLSPHSGDGIVQAKAGDEIGFCYDDLLDAAGTTVERCATTQVVGGTDGSLSATFVAQAGDTVRVRVSDADLVDVLVVPMENRRTAESESILLSQFSGGTSALFGRVFTATQASSGGDSALQAARYDTLATVYADTLTALGGTAVLDQDTYITLFGDCDGNGAIQAFDAARALLQVLLDPEPPIVDMLACNVDEDAPFDPLEPWDAAQILKKRVGLIDRFPIQEPCSANHPQPETCGSAAPKPVPEERLLALEAGEGYLSVWADEREGILSGDLLIAGVEDAARAGMAAELEDFLSVYQTGAEGLRIVFAGAAGVSGPGELLRVQGAGSGGARIVRASLNGGRIAARLDGMASPARIPASFALHANAPNPFNPETAIRFDLPTAAQVRLEVFDALGQQVRTLAEARLPAGSHRVAWDGRDATGTQAGSGVYFYRLRARAETASFDQVRRMILLK